MPNEIDEKQLSSLKSAFESSPLSVAILNSNLNIIYTNNAFCKRFINDDNPMGLYMLFEDIDKKTVINCLKSEKFYEFCCDLPDQNGALVTLNALFSQDERCEFSGALAIFAPKNGETGVFTSGDDDACQQAVNRELRDRINMMHSSIYALTQSKNFDPDASLSILINSLNQNCYQLLRASDNLSRILRITSHNDFAKFDLVNFSDYISTLVRAIVRMDNKNFVPIEFICNDTELPVQIDIAKMEFALSNIIANSIKYTKPNNKIKIILKRIGDNAVLSIIDKGAGMPKQVLDNIGTPYYSYSHKFDDAGFGIGLFIAKKYLSYHAASFSIQSRENEGTTVTISIPLDLEDDDDTPLTTLTLHSPPVFDPEAKYSQTRIQLSEVCYYPVL